MARQRPCHEPEAVSERKTRKGMAEKGYALHGGKPLGVK